jgi:Kef-type K+ transport system membrane component KefB
MPSEYQHATARPASLEEETRTVIGEARMVLPGIQAFFGFHLIALLLLAVSIALIMTPAAYHRIAERGMVSRRFVELASRVLECAMLPLMLSITVDLFLLTRFILDSSTLSAVVGIVTILMFFGLWYLFPWTQKLCAKRGHSGSPKA